MSYKIGRSKPPKTRFKGEWIGIEIECFMPYESLSPYNLTRREAYHKLGRLLKQHRITNVTLKEDGSIESPNEERFFEVEINLLINRHDYGPLQRLCDLLKALDTHVNKSCGLHVHLDCRDLGTTLERVMRTTIAKTYWAGVPYTKLVQEYVGGTFEGLNERGDRLGSALPLMLRMVNKSRRNNTYCSAEVSEVDGGHHKAINIAAFKKHGTIEVRLHQGTINFNKIKNWIEFLYFVSRNRPEFGFGIAGIRDLKEEFPNVPKSILEYVKKTARAA